MVELTEEEFGVIFDALELANSGYSVEEVPTVVALEGKAWTLVLDIKRRAGLPDEPPPSEAVQPS
jgi:hypothetical protein